VNRHVLAATVVNVVIRVAVDRYMMRMRIMTVAVEEWGSGGVAVVNVVGLYWPWLWWPRATTAKKRRLAWVVMMMRQRRMVIWKDQIQIREKSSINRVINIIVINKCQSCFDVGGRWAVVRWL
jgi:hypothetical protein